MEDFTARAANYAVYTPSAQIGAAEAILKADLQVPTALLEAGLTARALDYFWPQNGLWHYPYLLATAGHFKNATRPNVVTNRTANTVLVGDSSGYNLATGAMPETKAWKKYVEKPDEIMRLFRKSTIKEDVHYWLEQHADLAMTLDLPLWARGRKDSPFRCLSDEQLLSLTLENLEFFQQASGNYRKVKYLNVLQGSTEAVEEQWFQAVKGFKFSGYALAGNVGVMGGIYRVLRRILLLGDQGLLQAPLNNVHILMLSQPRWAPILTAIQRAVRETVNPDFTITYDSSSPYKVAGKASQYASCVDAPSDASRILGTVGHVIRCGRVSGLEDAACHSPRACMEICRSEPVRLPALDRAAVPLMVLPTRSLDRLPLRSLAPFHIRRQPSGSDLSCRHRGIPVILTLAQERPGCARHAVGKRHSDQHLRLAHHHTAEPCALWCALSGGPSHDCDCADDQQPSDIALAHLRNASQSLLASA